MRSIFTLILAFLSGFCIAQPGVDSITVKKVRGKYYWAGYSSPMLKLQNKSKFKIVSLYPRRKGIEGTWLIKGGKIFLMNTSGGKFQHKDYTEDFSELVVKVSDRGKIELWLSNSEASLFNRYKTKVKW